MKSVAERLVQNHPDLHSAAQTQPATTPTLQLESLRGRMVEFSSHGDTATLSLTGVLLGQAQRQGEPVAWVALGNSTFFPPDLVDMGIDLDALPVICLPHATAVARATDHLLRSGAFGLVVMDLGPTDLHPSLQTRLGGLAHRHRTALVALTRKKDRSPSLGSLISLRLEARLEKPAFNRFHCQVRALKDKQRGPGWGDDLWFRGPPGLC